MIVRTTSGQLFRVRETGETPAPRYKVGQIVTLTSGTRHKIYEVYEFKAARGFRYLTMTVRPDGSPYGPARNITDKTPAKKEPGA